MSVPERPRAAMSGQEEPGVAGNIRVKNTALSTGVDLVEKCMV